MTASRTVAAEIRNDRTTSVANAAATMAAAAMARRFKPIAAVKGRISNVAWAARIYREAYKLQIARYLCHFRGQRGAGSALNSGNHGKNAVSGYNAHAA